MVLRTATPDDVPYILRLEQAPHARDFVSSWSAAQHQWAMALPDTRYFIVESPQNTSAGFVILQGLVTLHRAIEMKRVVLEVAGRGMGRRLMETILHKAFVELSAHKLWLDVYEQNARARHLYRSLGFREDGVLRDADYRDGQFCTLILMSLLEDEYAARGA